MYVAETPMIVEQKDAQELNLSCQMHTVNGELGIAGAASYANTQFSVVGAHVCFSDGHQIKRVAGGISGGFFMPVFRHGHISILGNVDAGTTVIRIKHYGGESRHYGDFVRVTAQPQYAYLGRNGRVFFGARIGHIELNAHRWFGNEGKEQGLVADPYFGFGLGRKNARVNFIWTWNTQNYFTDSQRITFGFGFSSTLSTKRNQ